VSTLRMVTSTPGTAAPVSSVIKPPIVPVPDAWPNSNELIAKTNVSATSKVRNLNISNPLSKKGWTLCAPREGGEFKHTSAKIFTCRMPQPSYKTVNEKGGPEKSGDV